VSARDRPLFFLCALIAPAPPPAFSALGRQLDRINQDVCTFDDCTVLVPFGGAVFDSLEGQRIASFFRPDTKVALLQNQGALCLGRLSIDEAAW
jgi:hypothetical protein